MTGTIACCHTCVSTVFVHMPWFLVFRSLVTPCNCSLTGYIDLTWPLDVRVRPNDSGDGEEVSRLAVVLADDGAFEDARADLQRPQELQQTSPS